ncbi:unnamed protein product, partial [Colletotrichum noveboracense]
VAFRNRILLLLFVVATVRYISLSLVLLSTCLARTVVLLGSAVNCFLGVKFVVNALAWGGLVMLRQMLFMLIVDRLLDEAARLEDAEVAEEEVLRKKAAALRAAQAELDKSMARLDRLRKQKRMVFQKGREVTEEEPVASSVSEV